MRQAECYGNVMSKELVQRDHDKQNETWRGEAMRNRKVRDKDGCDWFERS